MGLYHRNRSIKGPNGENIQVPKGPRKNHDHAAKEGSKGSRTTPRNQIIPEVKEPLGVPRKTGPKHPHRKDITLPPTVAEAAQKHADEIGMSDVDYYNAAVVSYFSKVVVDPVKVGLKEPLEKCPTCGLKGNKLTKPNAPPESGFKRVRVGVRFTESVAKMMHQLAEDWFGGTHSHAFERAVRDYLGKLNPPPEGKGKLPGVQLPNGRPRRGETAEEKVVRALARGEG